MVEACCSPDPIWPEMVCCVDPTPRIDKKLPGEHKKHRLNHRESLKSLSQIHTLPKSKSIYLSIHPSIHLTSYLSIYTVSRFFPGFFSGRAGHLTTTRGERPQRIAGTWPANVDLPRLSSSTPEIGWYLLVMSK